MSVKIFRMIGELEARVKELETLLENRTKRVQKLERIWHHFKRRHGGAEYIGKRPHKVRRPQILHDIGRGHDPEPGPWPEEAPDYEGIEIDPGEELADVG